MSQIDSFADAFEDTSAPEPVAVADLSRVYWDHTAEEFPKCALGAAFRSALGHVVDKLVIDALEVMVYEAREPFTDG